MRKKLKSPTFLLTFAWCTSVIILFLLIGFTSQIDIEKEGNCYLYKSDGVGRESFLLEQLKREQIASSVFYITPDLTNAIATDEYLLNYIRRKSLEKDTPWKDNSEGVYLAMKSRKDSLEAGIISGNVKVISIFKKRKMQQQITANDSIFLRRYEEAYKLAKTHPSNLSLYCISEKEYNSLISNNKGVAIIIEKERNLNNEKNNNELERISIVRALQAHEDFSMDTDRTKITNFICEEDIESLSGSLYLKITAIALDYSSRKKGLTFDCFDTNY